MDMRSLFDLVDAQPFRPFELDLLNGRRIRIDHPENIHFFPGRHKVKVIFVYYPEPDDYSIVHPDGINAIHVTTGTPAA